MQPFLKALIAHIEEQGPVVFASAEDADYFRKAYRKQEVKQVTIEAPKPAALPPPIPKAVIAPPPAPKPPPEPVARPSLQAPVVNFTTVRNVLSVVAPELAVIDEIPNDDLAKKLSLRWKTKNQTAPLSILVYQESSEQRALLESIAKTLDVYFGPAKIVYAEGIEKAKQWETFLSVKELKMIIACDYTLWQLTSLMQFYKETPALGSRLLGSVPLFLLPDLSLYLKDAQLKRSLWKAICQKCS